LDNLFNQNCYKEDTRNIAPYLSQAAINFKSQIFVFPPQNHFCKVKHSNAHVVFIDMFCLWRGKRKPMFLLKNMF